MDGFCLEQVGLNCIIDSSNDSDSWERVSSKAEQPRPQENCDYSPRSEAEGVELLNALSIKSIKLEQDSERKLVKVSPRDCVSENANAMRQ